VILADSISALWAEVNELGFAGSSSLLCWAGLAAFSLEIYYDFSGYSDMATGLARFFGFKLPENFRTPYSSVSITEFWRRWHITMGQWFRDYVYIPLGGSRCSTLRNLLNLLVVWLLTGLWHGAAWNFIIWGLYYFIILAVEKLFLYRFLEKNRLIGHIYTIFITLIGWAVFAVDDISDILLLLSRLFGGAGGISAVYYLRNYAVIGILCLLLCTEQAASVWNRVTKRRSVRAVLILILLILSVSYIIGSTYHPFLYAQF
jgi:alginate O-acetyltransferase complex protein AlgI